MELASKGLWDSVWKYFKPRTIPKSYYLMDLLRQFLPSDPHLSCLEIGCVPGNFLAALHRNFGYRVAGLDFSDEIGKTGLNLEHNGITEYELFQESFLEFTGKRFDVVTSFGFLEHFNDVNPYLRKMGEILNPGGYLVLGIPNFRYTGLWVPSIKRTHNLGVMDLAFLGSQLGKLDLKKLYLGYYSRLMIDRIYLPQSMLRRLAMLSLMVPYNLLAMTAGKCLDLLRIPDGFLRKCLGPYIVFIGQKD
jgi:SAM-dependent methyltransferase